MTPRYTEALRFYDGAGEFYGDVIVKPEEKIDTLARTVNDHHVLIARAMLAAILALVLAGISGALGVAAILIART
jgi:hypothetical protein